jgi:hypothetical protein
MHATIWLFFTRAAVQLALCRMTSRAACHIGCRNVLQGLTVCVASLMQDCRIDATGFAGFRGHDTWCPALYVVLHIMHLHVAVMRDTYMP